MNERNSNRKKPTKRSKKSKSVSISNKPAKKNKKKTSNNSKSKKQSLPKDISKKTSKKNVNGKSKKLVNNKPTTKRLSRWVKGQSGNPNGRPKGSKNKFSIKRLTEALERMADTAGYDSTYDKVAEQFFKNDHVLIAMMKKLLPDLKSLEARIEQPSSEDDEKMAEIRKEYVKRFEIKKEGNSK